MKRNFRRIYKNQNNTNLVYSLMHKNTWNKIYVTYDFTLYMINLSMPKNVKKIRKYEDEKQTESGEYFYI